MPALFLGLMSGTSQDGVDAALVEFSGSRLRRVAGTATRSYPAPLRARLLHLARDLPALTPADYCALDQAVAETFALAARTVLARARVPASRVAAIGSHGQTVFHRVTGRVRSTLQLGDPNVIAARTGITTVADFRRRDLALGGHGAPLVPALHAALFGHPREARCVVNLGGIANVTVLPPGRGRVTGFDTGPANGLMDEWAQRHLRRQHDAGGRWGGSGRLHGDLLAALLADPYFARRAPKSTGRDYFNTGWARRRFPRLDRLRPADVQNTFAELTARSIADAVDRAAPRTRRVLVCGGGVRNRHMMERLRACLPGRAIESTGAHGLDPRWVEATAFAWMAMRTLRGLPGNVPSVTGASRASVLGGIYRG